jgi:hypothetical protein
MGREKVVANTPLLMEGNMKEAGRMEDMMAMAHALGRMDGDIKVNGVMEWLMGEGLRPTPMGIFDMKANGLMTSQSVKVMFDVMSHLNLTWYMML